MEKNLDVVNGASNELKHFVLSIQFAHHTLSYSRWLQNVAFSVWWKLIGTVDHISKFWNPTSPNLKDFAKNWLNLHLVPWIWILQGTQATSRWHLGHKGRSRFLTNMTKGHHQNLLLLCGKMGFIRKIVASPFVKSLAQLWRDGNLRFIVPKDHWTMWASSTHTVLFHDH